MLHEYVEVIRQRAAPLEPIPTDVAPVPRWLADIHAVLFDVYGTLFVSASGEVGTARPEALGSVFLEALAAVGIAATGPGQRGVDCLVERIRASHARNRAMGCEFPEVDIVAIWREVFVQLVEKRMVAAAEHDLGFYRRLAIEYEVRANPVWPMPGCREVLAALCEAGLVLGLISNAQFFTPYLFPALLGKSRAELGFHPELQFFSFEQRQAKPGGGLFRLARAQLERLGIAPDSVVYVGNDMRNDIAPAARIGFQTALFAGDRRSLRLRPDDSSIDDVRPDAILTSLEQLLSCVVASPPLGRHTESGPSPVS